MAGAAAASMDVQVNVNYIQSFSDVPLATEAAETHIANGADILTGTAQMVIGPIAVGKEAGTLWFGTQASQAELSENTGVMFQVYHWEVVLSEMIDLIKSGTLGGESYTINLANGGLEMQAGNGFADDRQKQALLERLVAALAADIASGDTVVFGG
jgi:basic membrane protein A